MRRRKKYNSTCEFEYQEGDVVELTEVWSEITDDGDIGEDDDDDKDKFTCGMTFVACKLLGFSVID